eukprot:3510227-Prymnesium_polylepis.1
MQPRHRRPHHPLADRPVVVVVVDVVVVPHGLWPMKKKKKKNWPMVRREEVSSATRALRCL